jgi:NADH:ubiquinone oxidoreductase subunit H
MIDFFTFPLSFLWFASCLAEMNWTPFDFAEGESEYLGCSTYEHITLHYMFVLLKAKLFSLLNICIYLSQHVKLWFMLSSLDQNFHFVEKF